MLASALNYLCQLFMAKVLSVESFGTINTIFSFMQIIAVPGTTLTMIVAQYFAGNGSENNRGEKQNYVRGQVRMVCALTLIIFLLLLTLSLPISKILVIDNTVILFCTFVLSALGFFQPLFSGVFSGNKYFIFVGIYSLLIPISKIISVAIAKLFTVDDLERLYIILFAMIIGTVVIAFIGQWKTSLVLGKFRIFAGRGKKHLFKKDDLNTLVLNISLMIYMNIDLLAVRYHETESASGLYSSVLLFGRIIYYFSTTLGTILLPSVATKGVSDKEKIKTLNRTIGVMLAFAIVCMLPINIWKDFFVKLLFGERYLHATVYVKYISLISFALCLYTLLVNYLVGIGKTNFVTKVMITIDMVVVGIAVLLKNTEYILCGIGFSGIIGAMVIYYWEIQKNKRDVRDV